MKTKAITRIMLTLFLAILVSSTAVVYATTYTISLEGYTWNHITITYFIKDHHAAWYSTSFKVAVESAIVAWNDAIDSFWSSYSGLWPDYIPSYVGDVQFQSVPDKHEADVEISFALYRGTVPPYAVAGVTCFFTEKNTNVLRKPK